MNNNIIIDKNYLVDLKNVHINENLAQQERVVDYIRQIKNPYEYRVGEVVVRLRFAKESGISLNDALHQYLSSLKSHA